MSISRDGVAIPLFDFLGIAVKPFRYFENTRTTKALQRFGIRVHTVLLRSTKGETHAALYFW